MAEDNDDNNDDKQASEYGWLKGRGLKPGAGGRIVHRGVTRDIASSSASAVVEYTLTALGYDSKDMRVAMESLDKAQLQAVFDKSSNPSDEDIPRPSGFDEEKFINVASSYAFSILDDLKREKDEASRVKDRKVSVVNTIIAGVAGLIAGGFGTAIFLYFLGGSPPAQ